MELQLKNIGMIKEASVKIDGLTVIAGENDTGKSTLSKALFFGLTIIKRVDSLNKSSMTIEDMQNILTCTKIFDVDILFGKNVEYLKDSQIDIIIDNQLINVKLGFGVSQKEIIDKVKKISSIPNSVFIETPIIWNLLDTFKSIAQIGQQMGIGVNHPYLMNDLAIKLSNSTIKKNKINISDKVKRIIQGNFKKDDKGIFFFEKKKTRVELINTATGIKYFGILQILSDNGWLAENNILILDEPEVHLHPKWQLEMAKIIVELVKNGVKIVVNSHSPYMIEALKVYSENKGLKDKTNFYLAEKNEDTISSSIKDVTTDLEPIFIKLAEPYRKLELELE